MSRLSTNLSPMLLDHSGHTVVTQWSHSGWPNRSQEPRASFPTRLQGSKPLKDKHFFDPNVNKVNKVTARDRKVEAKQLKNKLFYLIFDTSSIYLSCFSDTIYWNKKIQKSKQSSFFCSRIESDLWCSDSLMVFFLWWKLTFNCDPRPAIRSHSRLL